MNSDDSSTHPIAEALAALDGPAGKDNFACRATLPAATLALSIDGFGDLRLPVAVTQAKALAKVANPAPFGKGRATVVDPAVRDVGEIKASKVHFDRRAWNRELKPVLEAMRVELGLPEGGLRAKLDKLLVYGPGQFFKPHKDTERSDDMVGTLVVVLPSKHKGGSLVVTHQGEARRFQVRNPADPILRLFAFYATCEHEVRPVTEGHRVVLSFELRFKRAANFQSSTTEPALQEALESWFGLNQADRQRATKLVYLLDHEYSQRSLAWSQLKGLDHRRAAALQSAGEALGLQAYLALITVNESWSASDNESEYYSSRRKRRWYGYDEYEDEDDEDSDEATVEYELEELIENNASLAHLRDSNDRATDLPALQVSDEELCWLTGLDELAPVIEEYEGYMGNYGNTLTREYRRAVIVLWPAQDHYGILSKTGGQEGRAIVVGELARDAAELDPAALEVSVLSLLSAWSDLHYNQDSALLRKALTISAHLETSDTVVELLRRFSLLALEPTRFKALFALGERHGAEFCYTLFAHWMGECPSQDSSTLSAWVKAERRYGFYQNTNQLEWLPVLPSFCERVKALKSGAWNGVPETLFGKFHSLVVKNHAKNHAWTSRRARRAELESESAECISLLKAAIEIGDTAIDQVIDAIMEELEKYASEVPVAVLEFLDGESLKLGKKVETLRTCTRKLVNTRAEAAIRNKDDWVINTVPKCSCADCQSLTLFLQSCECAIDLPLASDRRRHLHDCIGRLEIPVSHSTRRQGRPYVLELRKLPALFKESAEEYERERELAGRAVLRSGRRKKAMP